MIRHVRLTQTVILNHISLSSFLWAGPRGWGTLIFSYIHRLGPFFGVQNFELQYFFELSDKFIGGMKILWIYF